ncbi:MAG: radical SAM protein, partial [Bacteroidales bacterium]|nr:radical SAM protein [Bacteroidales bacterium]
MLKIALIDVDGHHYPNLALMKIARYYRQQGDVVEWYTPFDHYDIVYLSKVFTFTPDYLQVIPNADRIERGGTGYKNYEKTLPREIDRMQPDYSIYPNIVDDRSAYGFLTRGCIRTCKWCIVPKKEGILHPYMDIEEIAIEHRDRITLMDNNILASDYGLMQIEKIVKLALKVDFNQDLDCRLVTP